MGKLGSKPARFLIDFPTVITTAILVIFGLIIIYDASIVAAHRDFGDKLYYFKNQLIWATLGTIALVVLSLTDYHRLIKYGPIFFLAALFLLAIVLLPQIGTKAYGARRWINVAGFNFQPSEFAKIALIFYETYILTKLTKFNMRLADVLYVLFLPTVIATVLVLLEPDLGSSLIFVAISLGTYFAAGGPMWHFLLMIPIVLAAAIVAVIKEPYRLARLKSFLDPNFDPLGASYQINQIIAAIAAGGLLGVGIGASRGKFDFIPEVQSDAILAVVAEEFGFIGALVIIGLLLFLISRAIAIARGARDFEGKILAVGLIMLLASQSILNLASIVVLIPLAGIPLPFISYGGSSLLVMMTSLGILLSIRRLS